MKKKGELNRFLLVSIIVGVCVLCGLAVIVISGSKSRRALSGLRIENFDQLILERSGCFGSCPIYKLVVMSNGEVIFEGKEYTGIKGELKDRITDDQIKRLVEAINQSDFFALGESYLNELDGCVGLWSDQPTAITTVVVQNRTKTIRHYLGCSPGVDTDFSYPKGVYPQGLSELEVNIDRIVDTGRWSDPLRQR